MRKLVWLAGVFLVVSAITTTGVATVQSGGGQTDKPKAESSAQKSDAKSHTMTGCLEKGTDENMFRLTNIEGTGPKTAELHADAKLKLSAHVGHKVAITGTAIDPKTMKGTATGTSGSGTTAGAESKGAAAEHHMRVTSMKHISPTCTQ